MSYPYEDNDEEDYGDEDCSDCNNFNNDSFDYDFYGPNSSFHQGGYGGNGFDDLPEGQPPWYTPEEPKQKLHDWERDDPKGYDQIMYILTSFCLKRNIRIMRKYGESPGAEKLLQALEADIDVGNCKLMNAPIDGIMRTCVYDFDPYSGKYILSQDN